jgi:hypothetical protein
VNVFGWSSENPKPKFPDRTYKDNILKTGRYFERVRSRAPKQEF